MRGHPDTKGQAISEFLSRVFLPCHAFLLFLLASDWAPGTRLRRYGIVVLAIATLVFHEVATRRTRSFRHNRWPASALAILSALTVLLCMASAFLYLPEGGRQSPLDATYIGRRGTYDVSVALRKLRPIDGDIFMDYRLGDEFAARNVKIQLPDSANMSIERILRDYVLPQLGKDIDIEVEGRVVVLKRRIK
jgi:hypothetical protein